MNRHSLEQPCSEGNHTLSNSDAVPILHKSADYGRDKGITNFLQPPECSPLTSAVSIAREQTADCLDRVTNDCNFANTKMSSDDKNRFSDSQQTVVDGLTRAGDCLASETFKLGCSSLSSYIEQIPADYLKSFLVPPKFYRHYWVMDIVGPGSKNSCCFTKGLVLFCVYIMII